MVCDYDFEKRKLLYLTKIYKISNLYKYNLYFTLIYRNIK